MTEVSTPSDSGKSKTHENSWDVIVIGSGMGGMSCAAALSKTGKRVLLLEQFNTLGGQTHSFSRDGFRWDVGIHYLSHLGPDDEQRAILDWLTDTPIELAPIGAVYDTLHIGDGAPIQLSRPTEAQTLDLKERFPKQSAAIDKWIESMKEAAEACAAVIQSRALPEVFAAIVKWYKRHAIARWCSRTTAEVVNEITQDPELAAVFSAQWGDFGGRPSTASFAMHAMIVGSYMGSGGWYPVGGASVISQHLLPTIKKGGGDARAGVEVDTLLFDDDRVVGVSTTSGESLYADAVVSGIGARETVEKLLPGNHGHQDWVDEIRLLTPNICHFTLFLGFSGDIAAAGATKSNHWLFPTTDTDVVWTDAPNSEPPGVYVSFASLKDPAHDPGPEQKHAGEMLAWADWSVVEPWAALPPNERGEDYQAFKQAIEDAMFRKFRQYFPRLAELVVYREVATPFATVAITGHTKGAFYGLAATPQRLLSNALRMKTPIEGLYLTGQDVVTPGVPGALWGGLLTAASIEPKVFKQFAG